jgi:hypothetical protein
MALANNGAKKAVHTSETKKEEWGGCPELDETLAFARGHSSGGPLVFVAEWSIAWYADSLGWKADRVPPRGSKWAGRFILPRANHLAFVPWLKNTFSRNPVTYLRVDYFTGVVRVP